MIHAAAFIAGLFALVSSLFTTHTTLNHQVQTASAAAPIVQEDSGAYATPTTTPFTTSPATTSTTPTRSYPTSQPSGNQDTALVTKVNTLSAVVNNLLTLIPTLQSTPVTAPTPDSAVQQELSALQREISQSNQITNLSNVTIQNPVISNLSASNIPDLSATYLSTSGGTLSGLGIFGTGFISQASSTVAGALTVSGALSLANPLALSSGGTGWSTITPGSILFGNGSSALATSTNLFWDNTNGRLGIGTTSPTAILTLDSSSPNGTIMRVSNSSTGGHIYDWLSTGSSNTGGAGRLDLFDYTAGQARLSIASNGNIGIATTTPGSLFSVQGIANWTTSTSTYYSAGGINLNGGCFAVAGTCVTGGGGGVASQLVSSYTVDAGSQSINVGDIVSYYNGHVQKALENAGTPVAANAVTSNYESAAELSSTSFVLVYEGTSNYAYAVIGTVSGTSITYGTPVALNAVTSAYESVAALSSTSFVVAYEGTSNYANAVVSTVSGTTITVGTPVALNAVTSAYESVAALSSTSFVVAYQGTPTYANAVVSTVSGTTITVGTPVALNAVTSLHTSTSVAALSSTSFVVAYEGTSNYADAVVSTVSGTTITVGTPVALSAVLSINESVAALSSTSFVVGCGTGGGAYAVIGTVSGTTITLGTPVVFNSIADSYTSVAALSSTSFVEGYQSSSGYATVVVGSLSGTTITADTLFTLNTVTSNYESVAALSSTSFVVAYQGTPTYANAVVAQTEAENPDSNILGMATEAASSGGTVTVASNGIVTGLSGLTAGSTYYYSVGTGATTTPETYKVGFALTSTSMLLDSGSGAGSDQYFGDAVFENSFRITENAGVPALDFLNDLGQQIMKIDEDGNLMIPGHLFSADNFATQDATSSVADLITNSFADASQALQNTISALTATSVRMLGSAVYATEGMFDQVFARVVNSDQDNTQKLCIGSTCVDEAQLAAILAQEGIATSSSAESSSTPPVIQINGANPAIVQVGTTYSDLGATITGPQVDLNLGIATYLNGTLENPLVVDTSSVATDTIDYVVTDQNGLTATSTRTLIIEAPADDTDSDATTTP